MGTWIEAPFEGAAVGGGPAATPSGQGTVDAADPWFVRAATPATRPAAAAGGARVSLMERDEAVVAICDVLAAWRAAERDLSGLAAGDPAAARLEAEIAGLRALHQRLFAARVGTAESDAGWHLSSWPAEVGAWLASSVRPMAT